MPEYELVCLHCTLKAMLAGKSEPPIFDESPEEHMAKYHADPNVCWQERQEIEAKIKERHARHDLN